MVRRLFLGIALLTLLLLPAVPLSVANPPRSSGLTGQNSTSPLGSVESGFDVVTVGYLRTGMFVGAEGGAHFVYVGRLNGTVWKMNPYTG